MKRSTAREIAVRLCFIISETSESPEVILSDMFEDDMFEMVCDWLAMSYEFGEKDWTEFWMNKMSTKFDWTEEQRLFISKLLVIAVENKKEIIELLDKNVKFPKWNCN